MKAVTIMQPWATLIATKEKLFETRSWPTKHRGKIAIHAGKKIDKNACQLPEIVEALKRHGIESMQQLPRGSVIAIANLTDCLQVIKDNGDSAELTGNVIVDEQEYTFGDFSKERYAWQLDVIKFLSVPVPAIGQLSLWNWEKC